MDLRELLAVVRSGWRTLLVAPIVAFVLAFAVSSTLPKVYEASTKLVVTQVLSTPGVDYNQILASQRLSQTFIELATTRPIASAVIAKLHLDETPDELIQSVRAEAAPNSLFLSLTVSDRDPARAARIADAFATALVDASSDIVVATPTDPGPLRLLNVVEPSVVPEDPTSPRVLLSAVLTGLLMVPVMFALVLARYSLDDRVRTRQQMIDATGIPAVGAIEELRLPRHDPGFYRLAALLNPRSRAAESFRVLRTNLDFVSVDQPLKTILVTSASAGEGKTTVAANLAIVFAQAGRRTILVDADLRAPMVGTVFELQEGKPGLTDLLRSDHPDISGALQQTAVTNLKVVTTGPLPPNPAELVGTDRMRRLITSLGDAADVVVIDSPPLSVADPVVLATQVDGTLLVVRAGKGRRGTVRERKEGLDQVNARVLGSVLNGTPVVAEAYPEYYGAIPQTDPSSTSA